MPALQQGPIAEAPVLRCACEGCGKTFDAEPSGGHRLLCGDSTSADAVALVMDGKRADLCLTDPPYGLGATVSVKNDYVEYDDTAENLAGLISGFLPLAQSVASVVVLTPGNRNQSKYPVPTWIMAWFTPAGVGVGPWGFVCWQPILCFGKDPKLTNGNGCYPDAVVHTETSEKNGHPCPKPVGFWSWLIERTSEAGDLIFEPFSGSGTTIVAAEKTGRTCYAIELSPTYVDIGVRRWELFTGNKAVLARDFRPFGDPSKDEAP